MIPDIRFGFVLFFGQLPPSSLAELRPHPRLIVPDSDPVGQLIKNGATQIFTPVDRKICTNRKIRALGDLISSVTRFAS